MMCPVPQKRRPASLEKGEVGRKEPSKTKEPKKDNVKNKRVENLAKTAILVGEKAN